jgi:hypothetical protein
MIILEDSSKETSVRNDAAPVVFAPNGALRPKRRWKSFPSDSSIEVSVEASPVQVQDQSVRHYRFTRSGQPHRIYPEVVTHIRTAPSEVSAIEMAQQVMNLVRSFSFR